MTLQMESDEMSRSNSIFERYEEMCHACNTDSRTYRRFRDFLAEMSNLAIISSKTENRSPPGGQYNIHRLNPDIKTVLTAMTDLVERVGVHKSIEEIVNNSDVPISTYEQPQIKSKSGLEFLFAFDHCGRR